MISDRSKEERNVRNVVSINTFSSNRLPSSVSNIAIALRKCLTIAFDIPYDQ